MICMHCRASVDGHQSASEAYSERGQVTSVSVRRQSAVPCVCRVSEWVALWVGGWSATRRRLGGLSAETAHEEEVVRATRPVCMAVSISVVRNRGTEVPLMAAWQSIIVWGEAILSAENSGNLWAVGAVGAVPRTPLGELIALPRPPSWWGRSCCPLVMKKSPRETKTLRAGCSKAEPKKFASPQTPFLGAHGRPKFNQLEMVTTFTHKPSLLRIDARNFELSW